MRICFDTGPLSAFAQAGRLEMLRDLCRPHEAVMTEAVRGELRNGATQHRELISVLDAVWIAVVKVDDLDTLRAFLTFTDALGAGDRHMGECTVLAWSLCNDGVALLDDADARVVGRRERVNVKGTLGLIADGVIRETLGESVACTLIDDLVAVGYRLPCAGSTFASWARKHGLFP